MKKANKFFCLLLALLLVCSMTACGGNSDDGKKNIILTDHLGREVTLDAPAKTVASGYYISTTTLIALGAEDQLVGVEMKADSREIYQLAAPQIVSLPSLGNKKNFNLEECASLKPDLLVLPMGLKDYVEQLEALDIPTVVINPENMEDFLDTVTLLGKATGHEQEADKLIAYYADLQKKITDKVGSIAPKKQVYFSAADDVLRSATASMFQYEVVTGANGKAVFTDITDKSWTEISAEQLLAYNPEFLFMENGGDSSSVLSDAGFAALDAVKEGNVFAFPSKLETWDTPSPASVLGIYWMSAKLYPDAVPMEEVENEAISFYREFFDITVTPEQLGL